MSQNFLAEIITVPYNIPLKVNTIHMGASDGTSKKARQTAKEPLKIGSSRWPQGKVFAAVAGVMRSCRDGGSTMPAQGRCWGGRGAVGVLRCWRGGNGALVAGRDDGGSKCAVRC